MEYQINAVDTRKSCKIKRWKLDVSITCVSSCIVSVSVAVNRSFPRAVVNWAAVSSINSAWSLSNDS